MNHRTIQSTLMCFVTLNLPSRPAVRLICRGVSFSSSEEDQEEENPKDKVDQIIRYRCSYISPTDIDLTRQMKMILLHLCRIGSKLALK